MLNSVNPASGEVLAEYTVDAEQEIFSKAEKLSAGWENWRTTSFAERAAVLKRLAASLLSQRDELALLMTREMGKPISQSMAEVEKCAWVCDFYAENGEHMLADRSVAADAPISKVVYRPLGVLLAIMPWNFPLWQVFRCLAPNLMGGNTFLLKHASNVTGCALAIRDLAWTSGVPEDVFDVVFTPGKQMSSLIARPEIAAVTLTGSTDAGKKVAGMAGAHLKKCVLELGGSDAYIILEDADLQKAAEKCAASRMLNNGQSCIAAKRFIVVESVYDEFMMHFAEAMACYEMGDPQKKETLLGPMARTSLRDELHQQVEKSVAEGAEVILGGFIPDREGAYYPATILTRVAPGMAAFEEELFGPVAAVIRAADEAEAIKLANQSVFGLGGAIFSRDVEHVRSLAEDEIQAGSVFINDFVRSDPRLPFGGIKESGYGRELSEEGIREFMNAKTIYAS